MENRRWTNKWLLIMNSYGSLITKAVLLFSPPCQSMMDFLRRTVSVQIRYVLFYAPYTILLCPPPTFFFLHCHISAH